jgi:hypothetical protein
MVNMNTKRSPSRSAISVDGRGPEGKNIIAGLTEEEITTFCQRVLGWRVLFTNIDARIPHTLPLGLFKESERGLDCLCSALNPFLKRREGVVVETKHVATGTRFQRSRLEEWVCTLREKIENIRASQLQRDPDVTNNIDGAIHLGLLVIRFRHYDEERFWKEVSEAELPRYRGTGLPLVLVITNDRLSPLVELCRREKGQARIEYYYPRYLENPTSMFSESLAVNYLFSDVIFGRLVSPTKSDTPVNFVLMFEGPQPETLRILKEMYLEFRSPEFDHIDRFIFARGNYYDEPLYRDRLANAGFGQVSPDAVVVLPQQFDMSFNISKELKK